MSTLQEKPITIVKKNLRIAISGLSGCGNTTICKELAHILRIECINYTFRSLAKDRNMSMQEIACLSEKSDDVDRLVDRRQKELAANAQRCVIGSRLAIWFIHDASIKIYLKVKKAVRYARIQQRENKSIEQVIQETSARDHRDTERYKRIYNINIDDYESVADTIIHNNGKDSNSTITTILSILKQKELIRY